MIYDPEYLIKYCIRCYYRVVLRWNRAKVIANIDDLAISIWALKVIDEVSKIDDILTLRVTPTSP